MTTPTINTDILRERIRERLEEGDPNLDTLCRDCQATLTATDRAGGYCTQCGTEIDMDDKGADEDLYD